MFVSLPSDFMFNGVPCRAWAVYADKDAPEAWFVNNLPIGPGINASTEM
jgi:hypothetical protein